MDKKHKIQLIAGFYAIDSGEHETKIRIPVPRPVPAQIRTIRIPAPRVAEISIHRLFGTYYRFLKTWFYIREHTFTWWMIVFYRCNIYQALIMRVRILRYCIISSFLGYHNFIKKRLSLNEKAVNIISFFPTSLILCRRTRDQDTKTCASPSPCSNSDHSNTSAPSRREKHSQAQ